ncbi:hypothetical protein G7Y89_g7757 [Cudoniella acicularis]|uniref:Uncharacterized protein n=1 Tax=Cudoniella acicularis TaxID=354080 RepID=A0A8H4RLF7_9HELO|nr:hypothetical protein G7Y89_g7757 [Cudoniella acicularis]
MATQRSPGNFILETANVGLALVAKLSYFRYGSKLRDIIHTLSFNAAILTEVGREVNKHEQYFKDNFQTKFECVLVEIKEKHEVIRAALEKARRWKESESQEDVDNGEPPKMEWNKNLWSCEIKKGVFDKFDTLTEDFYKPAQLLQFIVQLVVLQKHAQERELVPSERSALQLQKKNIGETLGDLRKCSVSSLFLLGLSDAGSEIKEDALYDAININAREASIRSTLATLCGEYDEKTKEASLQVEKKKQATLNVELKTPNTYKLYRLGYHGWYFDNDSFNSTSVRVLGLPFIKHENKDFEMDWHMDKLPATQDEIKDLIQKEKASNKNYTTSALQTMTQIPAAPSVVIFEELRQRNKPDERTGMQTHEWFLEGVMPFTKPGTGKRWWRKKAKDVSEGFIVIFRGEENTSATPASPPPSSAAPLSETPVNPPKVKKPAKEQRVVQIELTQEEAEDVVNDFLATFSTLYDGVPVEKRGAAIKEIPLPETLGDDRADSASTHSSSPATVADN